MKRAMLCLLVACGGDDAPPLEPPPFQQGQAVTVQITSRGLPVPDVQVMFQNADQSVISVGGTDAAGKLGADIDNGGYVTVVQPRPTNGRDVLTTFAGVQQGDALHLDIDEPGPTDTRNATVRFVADPAAAVIQYRVSTNCGEIGVAPDIDNIGELLGCGEGRADLLLTSHDGEDALISSVFVDNGDLTTTINFTPNAAADYKAAVAQPVTFAPADGDITVVGVHRAFATERGIVFETNTTASSDGVTFTSAVPMPDFTGSTGFTMITATSAFVGLSYTTVQDWAPDPGATARAYQLNLASDLLPRFLEHPDGPTLRPAVYAIDTGTASWFEASGGVEPDVVRIRLSVFRDAIPVGRGWDWRMIAPRSGTALAFPRLPVDLTGFDYTPAEDDTVGVSELNTAKVPATELKTVREHGFERFNAFRAGPAGRIVFQELVIPDPEQPQ